MKKKSIVFGSLFLATALVGSTLTAVKVFNATKLSRADTLYTLTLDASNAFTSETQNSIYTTLGTELEFSYSSCQASSGNHVQINNGGYFKNETPINGITSFTAVFDGDLAYSNGGASSIVTSGNKVNVSNYNTLKFSSSTGATVKSISITYTCNSEVTYDPANYYDGYYSSIVSWENGEDLKQQLHDLIRTGYTALAYDTPNWESNKDADRTENSYLELNALYTSSPVLARQTNVAWQREHAFCASLMTGSTTSNAVKFKGRATDFHNLFAASSNGNTSRGNKNYGNANAGGGADNYTYNTTTFEPGDYDKGRVSRALFYMCTMYKDDELDTRNNITMKGLTLVDGNVNYVAGNDCKFAHGNLSDLLEWNNDIPVDRLEMQHNVSVYSYEYNGTAQGNRNPYVDYPGLVDYVYGNKQDQAGQLNKIKPSAIDLDATSDEHRNYTIKDAKSEYGVGETFAASDVTIYEVKKNFSVVPYTGAATYSLAGHTFSDSDGSSMTATVTVGGETRTYPIKISGLTTCSYQYTFARDDFGTMLTKATSSSYRVTTLNTAAECTFGGVKWMVTFITSAAYLTTSNISGGGIKFGSGTYKMTGFTMETVDSYTVDRLYFKGKASNTSSSFALKISVNGVDLVNKTVANTTDPFIYGGGVTQSTGKIKLTFTGTNALDLNVVAFNEVA